MVKEQTSVGHHSWLLEQIRTRYPDGEELITASKTLGKSKQYTWLLAQLSERGELEIIEGFHSRRRAEVNERAWEQKRRRLAWIEENLAYRRASSQKLGLPDDSYSLFLAKRADKLRTAIEKHELQ